MAKTLANQNSSTSTYTLVLGIWHHLSLRRRFQMSLLLLVMLSSGCAELLSLGAIIPFLSVLSDPETLWDQQFVQTFVGWFGLTQASQLILPASLLFSAAAVLAALIRLINLWLNGRLSAAVGSDLSCEAYRRTLLQPYSVHLQRNSSEVITAITRQINLTVVAVSSLLQLITSVVVAAGLLTGLLLINAPVALSAAAIFGGAYGLVIIASRRELSRNSRRIADVTTQQVKAVQEGLGAIRDVLLDCNQSSYLNIYRSADRTQRQLLAKNSFLSIFPRYAFEALGMVLIAVLGGVLLLQFGSGAAVIPLLGAMALGAQRLLPALQQIYSGWAVLKSRNAPIKAVLDMLNQPLPYQVIVAKPLKLLKSIRFEGVSFCYSPEKPNVLKGLNLEINFGERIGLIGTTGSGKTTTVDLLMGLLEPTSGRLLIDGEDLHDPEQPQRLAAWRATIPHVPQSIYLADTSIAENIAFGVPYQQIDMARVKYAAEQAQIASFIESSSEGYSSFVGERGVRLSGGQRQRIGIARALYKQASVLVLDEATSALDTQTEKALMDSVNALSHDLTILMIAHRLSTVRRCDRIVKLDDGVAVFSGSPDELPIPFLEN